MSGTTRIWIAAIALACLGAAQTNCGDICEPKLMSAIKCSTFDCVCYAYDDPEYVVCMQSECGRGYDSVRQGQVLGCEAFGATLSPSPPGTAITTTAPGVLPSAVSKTLTVSSKASTRTSPEQTSPTTTLGSGNGSGSGSGSGTGSGTGSGSAGGGNTPSGGTTSAANSNPEPPKSGLSTGELIGIVIGGVSAIATIIGVVVTMRKKNKGRKASVAPGMGGAYQPLGVQQVPMAPNNFQRPFQPVQQPIQQPFYPHPQPMQMQYPPGPPPNYKESLNRPGVSFHVRL